MKIFNLQKSFGQFSLHIQEMQLRSGQIYGLIGANGCGKSTMVKLLAGLITPDAGVIDYKGLDPRDITLVQQKPYLMRDTVMANLTYPLKIRKIKPDKALLNHYLELAGLQDLRQAYAPGLSGGEAQKLALIRAMIFSPKLIFADETFSNMDIESQARFEKYVLEQQKITPITWVVISHQLSTIKRMCGYTFFMESGEIKEEGETGAILTTPETPSLGKYVHFMNALGFLTRPKHLMLPR